MADDPDQDPADRPKLLRDTDEDARHLARILVRSARSMSLAVIDTETGFPAASRVLTGTDVDGAPVILVSALAGHTRSLDSDPRSSLLAGEITSGDPLSQPRIMLQTTAIRVEKDSEDHRRVRNRFLERHKKAKLYVDFPDFRFYWLMPQKALLNGGFGRAFALKPDDLLIPSPGTAPEWTELHFRIREMKEEAGRLAQLLKAVGTTGWRFSGVDRAGIDLTSGDQQLRYEFESLAESPECALQHICNASKVM